MKLRTENDIVKNWDYNLPLVSIKCLAYNHEKYIAQCLDSFLMQETKFPIEIVIHDDASIDNTPNIIRTYKKRYPRIIKPIFEKENQYSKLDGNLQKIIDLCIKGKYVACCEGDDYWCDIGKLQKQFDFLEANSDYFAVGHMTKSVDANNNVIETFINSKPGEYTLKDCEKWQLFSHYSSYFYRNYIKFTSENIYQDYLSIKCPEDRKAPVLFMLYGKLYVLPDVCSIYRYKSNPFCFTNNANLCTPYRQWLEGYLLKKFAHNNGIDLSFKDRQRGILFEALIMYIKGSKEDYKMIAKYRNSSLIKDIVLCSDLFIDLLKTKMVSKE